MKRTFLVPVFLLFLQVTYADPQIISHFIFAQYEQASILNKNKKIVEAKLNYNTVTEEMVFIAPDGQYKALYPIEQVDTIYIKGRKFIPMSGVFYEVLPTEIPAYINYKCRISTKGQSIGYGTSNTASVENISSINQGGELYQLKLPDLYKVDPYIVYWIRMDGNMKRIRKIKDLQNLFPQFKMEITTYSKKNKVKMNDPEKIADLIDYISGLL